jgi:hypothetical protein
MATVTRKTTREGQKPKVRIFSAEDRRRSQEQLLEQIAQGEDIDDVDTAYGGTAPLDIRQAIAQEEPRV